MPLDFVQQDKAPRPDPLRPVACKIGPPWVVFVLARPTDAQLDWDLGQLETRSTCQARCHVPRSVPEQFF